MWNAIKSDLFDFVATIQEDTSKSLNKVLGDIGEEGDDEATILNKKAADVRRSFESYGTPIKDKKLREYQTFLKTFNLGAFANDIASVLDEEPEVSRFYAELVPSQITPEEFWARLFFRLNMVYRSGNSGLNLEDEDEEEELSWDAEPSGPATTVNTSNTAEVSAHGSVGGGSIASNVPSSSDLRAVELKDENDRLKSIVKTLTGRVTDLEQQLAAALRENETQARLITSLRTNALLAESETVQKSTSRDDNKTTENGNNADNVSQCSGDSGIVLHNSDTMSFPDEDSRHGVTSSKPAGSSATTTGAVGTATAANSSSITSKTTRAYLAAVDDNEEDAELDGWS